jgi:tetratricopeptide (TPR) repeat protein
MRSHWEKQALHLLRRGKIREAEKIASDLLARHPKRAEPLLLMAEIAMCQQQMDKAIAFADRAVNNTPDDPLPRARLALYYLKARKVWNALAQAHRASVPPPESAQLCDFLGTLLSACGNHESARVLLERACDRDPGNANFAFNLSMELRFIGDRDRSEQLINRALEVNPAEYEGYLHRAGLRTQTQESNHITELLSVLETCGTDWRGQVQLQYALAKEYEDIGDYEAAFTHLKAGADLRWSHTRYDINRDLETVEQLIQCFSVEKIAAPTTGYHDAAPIFIVGMPRTGTTLVERILASHSQVIAAGELQDFAIEMVKLVGKGTSGTPLTREELIPRSLEIDFVALGRHYVDAAQQRVGDRLRFIDKMPLNYLYCGLIHKALPEARIIHVTRHPVDTCYAIYKTLFKNAYPFSYNLETLGQYYLAYRKLMEHWQKVLPRRIFEMSYEDLVSDQALESRRLLEFCDLDWEQACLEFHKSTSASTTASSIQVRRPVYRSSVGRWRCYRQQLQPLLQVLKRGNIDCD